MTVGYAPVALAATGGIPPCHWTVGGGALPPGLTLSADGGVSGTPAAAGTFAFTAHVADTGDRAADVPGSIAIVPAPSASLIAACAQYCAVEQGCDSSCGAFGTVAGGTAPYGYALQGGYVPHGVSVSGLALAGTFTDPAKFWQFTVLVTDALGATASISPTFYVYPHLGFSGSAVCKGNYNTPCSVTMAYSGGTPGGSPTVSVIGVAQYCPTYCYIPTPTAPPSTFSATASGGIVTISVQKACGYPGVGGCPNGYGGIVSLRLTDQSQCSASAKCTSTGTATVAIEIQGG